jgi:hypothetical protein
MVLHHPSLVLVLASLMGIAVATILIALGALWSRVRSLSVEETARRVDDLTRRQETIESLLTRLGTGTDRGRASAPNEAATAAARASGTTRAARGPGLRPRPSGRVDRAEPGVAGCGGPTLIAVPSLAAVDADASEAAAELGRRFGTIWALADAGNSPEAIARTTGQPIGQIELILGLRRQLLQMSQSGAGGSRPR